MARTVTLSVKKVPVDLARRLKARAERNHRSLQGELRVILEQADDTFTLDDLARLSRKLSLGCDRNESTQGIREDRDDPRR